LTASQFVDIPWTGSLHGLYSPRRRCPALRSIHDHKRTHGDAAEQERHNQYEFDHSRLLHKVDAGMKCIQCASDVGRRYAAINGRMTPTNRVLRTPDHDLDCA